MKHGSIFNALTEFMGLRYCYVLPEDDLKRNVETCRNKNLRNKHVDTTVLFLSLWWLPYFKVHYAIQIDTNHPFNDWPTARHYKYLKCYNEICRTFDLLLSSKQKAKYRLNFTWFWRYFAVFNLHDPTKLAEFSNTGW